MAMIMMMADARMGIVVRWLTEEENERGGGMFGRRDNRSHAVESGQEKYVTEIHRSSLLCPVSVLPPCACSGTFAIIREILTTKCLTLLTRALSDPDFINGVLIAMCKGSEVSQQEERAEEEDAIVPQDVEERDCEEEDHCNQDRTAHNTHGNMHFSQVGISFPLFPHLSLISSSLTPALVPPPPVSLPRWPFPSHRSSPQLAFPPHAFPLHPPIPAVLPALVVPAPAVSAAFPISPFSRFPAVPAESLPHLSTKNLTFSRQFAARKSSHKRAVRGPEISPLLLLTIAQESLDFLADSLEEETRGEDRAQRQLQTHRRSASEEPKGRRELSGGEGEDPDDGEIPQVRDVERMRERGGIDDASVAG
eukprot:768815-Hanusia_phi.AAC.8